MMLCLSYIKYDSRRQHFAITKNKEEIHSIYLFFSDRVVAVVVEVMVKGAKGVKFTHTHFQCLNNFSGSN